MAEKEWSTFAENTWHIFAEKRWISFAENKWYSNGRKLTRPPRWAPRVPRHKIRQLYETDAKGIYDEDPIHEVSYGLAEWDKNIEVNRNWYRSRRSAPPKQKVGADIEDRQERP